jgi:ubiquinone/menaquinone biosynthesis C-methylase UbiE
MSEYQDAVFKHHEALFLEISECIDLKGKKVLDFGHGSGAGTVAFSLKGLDIIGVDSNQVGGDNIADAARYAAMMGSKAAFFLMDGEKMDFSDHSMDVVLAIDVLEHLTHPVKIFEEMKRVLKPQGHLVIVWQPYYAPYGGHLKLWSKNPWRQFMPFFNKEKFLKKACQRDHTISYDAALGVINSLNKLTLGQFRKIVAGMQWEVVAFKKRNFKLDNSVTNTSLERFFRWTLNKLPLVPILEEFTTQSVLVILKKRG